MVTYLTPSVEGPKPPSIGWLQPYLDWPFSGLRPFLAQCLGATSHGNAWDLLAVGCSRLPAFGASEIASS